MVLATPVIHGYHYGIAMLIADNYNGIMPHVFHKLGMSKYNQALPPWFPDHNDKNELLSLKLRVLHNHTI